MEKRIFTEEIVEKDEKHQPKQEFSDADIQLDEDPKAVEAELIIEESLKPSCFWLRLFLAALALFGVATIAQSVQWLIDTWQANQWIYFAFAVAFFGISLTGVGAIINEWRKLRWLRKHHYHQQVSQQLLLETADTSGEKAREFCKLVVKNLAQTPMVQQAEQRWQSQLDEAYNSKEVLYLFSENVLSPIDNQVKKMISKNAAENAIIVAVSPLALVDILMVAWRNIALVNKITKAYGMELGYISRLKLFRMVMTNMVFAGATEIACDVGLDFFSQNLTARLSVRAAQGIGMGLLTARLGIKAMEFCRPVVFQQNERPKLSVVRQELLGVLKEQMFSKSREEFEFFHNN
ncbi:TIGR01620 family protein [Glaesserella parasuis]|uniref:TIGR01620 family protein n=1 Tax=Glaesserella parasuis TaxID=738 RepID=UPI002436F9AA|nr:TIGR01620 family protein [Glaesserella parasuis]MDG6784421.1 TIGR01620 family protein [Glaesserella parasuis]